MSETIFVSKIPMRRLLQQISSKFAFYYDTMVGFAVPAISVNLLNDTSHSVGNLLDWLTISSAGYAAAALVLLLARRLFFKRARIPLLIVLTTFVLAGLVRGVVIYYLGIWFNVVSTVDFNYRVGGSTIYTTFVLGLITVLVSNAVRTSRKIDELEQQALNLQDALNNLREKLVIQKAELAGRVKALVYPTIRELIEKVAASRASGSVTEAVEGLKQAVDLEIRPLSLSITNNGDSGLLALNGKPEAKFRLFTRLEEPIQVASMISPFWMSLFMILISTSASVHMFGIEAGFKQIGLVAAVGLVLLLLAKRALTALTLRQDRAFGVQIAVYAFVGLSIDIVLTYSPFNTINYTPGRVTLFVLIVGIGFFIGQIFQLQRESAARKLKSINSDLEKLTASARRELWIYRRKVATVLHGPVQARLYASAMRLSQSKRVTKTLVNQVSAELQDAISELDFDGSNKPSLRQVIREITDVWSGTCEVYSKISPEVFKNAKRNSEFNEAFIEVMREAVSNAVKHSKATEIEIAAELVGDLVLLRITNDGEAFKLPVEGGHPGFGTVLFDELTLEWKLIAKAPGQTCFEASLLAN